MDNIIQTLLKPKRLVSRSEAIGRRSIVPAESGIYAWYFRESPSSKIDLTNCWQWQNHHLLYIGISPSKPMSKHNLRKRIRGHMSGNASGSTLRLSLGCLLSTRLGIQLQKVGRSGRMTFADGEKRLSDWMAQNSFLTWATTDQPWVVEEEAVATLYLSLNLSMNKGHPFHPTLSAARQAARRNARDASSEH